MEENSVVEETTKPNSASAISGPAAGGMTQSITYIHDNVLILSRLVPATGNFNTAHRIRKLFEGSKFFCTLRDPDSFDSIEDFQDFVAKKDITCVIGLHALRSGKLLIDCPVPYGIIFGGTDINESSKDQELMAVMTEIVTQASVLVVCSPSIEKKALSLWPHLRKKFISIPPGVTVHPSACPSLEISKKYALLESNPLFLTLVAGIRPVKDPLYLVQTFTEWHQLHARHIFLIIMGPVIDLDYANRFHDVIDGCPGVLYVGSLAMPDAHAIMKNSFAIVNTSLSEGICTAILEAMKMEVPVLARHIQDNAVLIENGRTGLLFRSPDEFISHVKTLESSPQLRAEITTNAKQFMMEKYSPAAERKSFLDVTQNLCEIHRENLRLLREEEERLEEERRQREAEEAEAAAAAAAAEAEAAKQLCVQKPNDVSSGSKDKPKKKKVPTATLR